MINRILERLEEYQKGYKSGFGEFEDELADRVLRNAISIVREAAKEYGNGWIPCEVALPKEATTYEVTCEIILCSEKQYITTYALWGTEGEWICRKNERVIAWKEKSAPYQPKSPSRCVTCANYDGEEIVDNICYLCWKGFEDNYKARESKA